MDLAEALAFLDRHVNLEARAGRVDGLSLDRMQRLVGLLGDPHRAYPVIHVTGTNGKGSVGAMISALLAAQGLHAGTYSSPHVSALNERLRTNGEAITDDDLAEAVGVVAAVVALLDEEPSWFELLSAAAFTWFADIAVDAAVVEVGLLGRYDATNVVDAAVAVVTNVGRDHTDGSAGWEEAIASEKAGIVTPGSTLVLGETRLHLRDLFVAEGPARVVERGIDLHLDRNDIAVGGRVVDLRTPHHHYADVFIPLHGAHQGHNALLAVAATEAFFDAALPDDVVAEGLAAVHLPGRAEVVARTPLVVLDGAHNPDAARTLVGTLDDDFAAVERRILVVGMLTGRDVSEVLAAFDVGSAALVVVCAPDWPRALPPDEVAAAARALGAHVEIEPVVADAVDRALEVAHDSDLVVVTGSFYVVGEARDHLGVPDRA